jgi:Common central domain of tyrosinase/Polyphenol oxidase middle domain
MIACRIVHVLVVAISIYILSLSGADAQQVRMRWQDFVSGPGGAARLASLVKAITKMKSLDATDPVADPVNYRRSWHYWSNIHGYYGSQSPDGSVQDQIDFLRSRLPQFVKYYDGTAGAGRPIIDETPPDAIAAQIWATCEHGDDTNFFGWHRMYLYYFERVLRWAADDNTLRLPYWDYTDRSNVALPAEFRSTASVLFDLKRQPALNNGTATLDPNMTNVDNALTLPDFGTYQNTIQDGVHGHVHCTVGPRCPVAFMGDVPVAGNDPVFYHHHANIDRLWACWQNNHTTPPAAWQNQMFSFVDETGTLVTKQVKDFLDTTQLGYVYDNVSSCARAPTPTLVTERVESPPTVTPPTAPAKVLATQSIAIRGPTTSVNLNVPPSPLESLMATARSASTKVELVLRDVAADSPPGSMFNVYLEKTSAPANRQYVGTLSWFSDFSHRRQGHGGQGHGGTVTKTWTFDVTNQLRALGAGTTGAGLTTVIEASSGLVSTNPATLSTLREDAASSFQPEANLRIGSIELQTAPASGASR